MKKTSGIWIRKGLFVHYLHGQELALALLLKQKPLSALQICAELSERGVHFERKQLGKCLARLERWHVISNDSGVYSCQCDALIHYKEAYSESQLIDLVGLTQNTVNGQSFYSSVPPMSVSSRGPSGA